MLLEGGRGITADSWTRLQICQFFYFLGWWRFGSDQSDSLPFWTPYNRMHDGKKYNLNLLKTLATESACAVVLLYVTLTHWNVKTGLTNQGSISNKSLHELQKTPGIKTRKGSLGFYIKWACGSCVVFVVCVCACVWWVLFISLLQSKFWNALLHIAF